jgi:hypothetical protein
LDHKLDYEFSHFGVDYYKLDDELVYESIDFVFYYNAVGN